MRVLVGDETGLLKSIALEKKEQIILSAGTKSQCRSHGIQRMCWHNVDQTPTQSCHSVALARANGSIERFAAQHELLSEGIPQWSREIQSGNCVGLDVIEDKGSILHATDSGIVSEYNPSTEKLRNVIKLSERIECMRLEPRKDAQSVQKHFAVGGKEVDAQIWSLETQQLIFRAKNVPLDKLQLRVPVWVRDVTFHSQGNSNGHRIMVGTGYHQIRLYDTNTQRRPIQSIDLGDHPINAMCIDPNELYVYVADTTGCLDVLDLRTLKHLGRFLGPDGAIRSLSCHPTLPYLAAVGLDRMVQVFDINSRSCQHSIYAKQRLNAVLFCDEGIVQVAEDSTHPSKKQKVEGPQTETEEFDDEDDGDEEVYEGLELSEIEQDSTDQDLDKADDGISESGDDLN
uniref:Uncharacterized protein AlNc14C40G3451 n=1 Tax=Albugo laibachii Nc14 TaxID=890382 RepID=F0W9J2_9STRA|nr:conserved hypothetical protein [Albugo laibachii Nc14]|eukprot:CCA17806.1 conserved hypothetical protein [Albugo laibachii Nc14]